MKYIVSLFIISCILTSCKKDNFPPHDDFYLQMRVNGNAKAFGTCGGLFNGGGGECECTILGDTAVFIAAGCGAYASFYINTTTTEGIYDLNGHNIASVTASGGEYNDYTTDSIYTGSITIKKVFFKNLNCLEGTFFYKGIDTSGVVGTITEGSFLMPIGG